MSACDFWKVLVLVYQGFVLGFDDDLMATISLFTIERLNVGDWVYVRATAEDGNHGRAFMGSSPLAPQIIFTGQKISE